MSRWDPLFGRRPLAQLLAARLDEARTSISKLPRESLVPEQILSVTTRAQPRPLVLGEHTLEVVDSSPAPKVRLEIKVKGDRELWWTTPSKTASGVPDGELVDDVLVFDQPLKPSFDAEAIRRWREGSLERIERWVGWVNADLASFGARLTREVERAVADRRAVLDRLDGIRRELSDEPAKAAD